MVNESAGQRAIEKLYDFAQLVSRVFQLYEAVRVPMTQELLLSELHQRLHQLNGGANLKPFKPYLTILGRLLTEIPSHPEHVEAVFACAEQLICAVEQNALVTIGEADRHLPRLALSSRESKKNNERGVYRV